MYSIIPKLFPYYVLAVFLFGAHDVSSKMRVSNATGSKLNTTFVINGIELQGNRHTKSYIILRELGFVPGDTVARQDLEKAKKRIENLNLFNRVTFYLDQQTLLINLTERWYVFPIPILFWNEHDFKKLSYGMGVFHYNFRGRAELLAFSGWWGFNPGYSLQYVNRWFGGKHRFYSEITFFSKRVDSKTLEFPNLEERHRGFSLVLGKRWGFYTFSDLRLEYDVLYTNYPDIMLSGTARDHLLRLQLHFKYDSRDLWEYPRRGMKAEWAFSRCSLQNFRHPYRLLKIDWRYYHPVKAWILATRLAWEQSFGKVAVYDRLFLGYDQRVRGHFQHICEGENRSVFSLETRFPVFKIRYFDLYTTILGSYLHNLQFGVYGSLFFDSGVTWFQDEKITLRHYNSGFGGGLNFLLPYSTVLRLEWAWDENLHPELIFDGNVAF